MCFGELPLQRMRSDGQAFKPTRQRRVLPGICAETAGTTAERLDNSEAATTPVAIVADGRRCEWHIPVRATQARCAKIPAIVMVISFRHVRS